MIDGALMSDNTIIVVDRVQSIRLWAVRVVPLTHSTPVMVGNDKILTLDSIYEIENKLCEEALL